MLFLIYFMKTFSTMLLKLAWKTVKLLHSILSLHLRKLLFRLLDPNGCFFCTEDFYSFFFSRPCCYFIQSSHTSVTLSLSLSLSPSLFVLFTTDTHIQSNLFSTNNLRSLFSWLHKNIHDLEMNQPQFNIKCFTHII